MRMEQRLSETALEYIQEIVDLRVKQALEEYPTVIFCQDCKHQCKSLVVDSRFEEGVVERCSCSLNYFNLGKDGQFCSLGEKK